MSDRQTELILARRALLDALRAADYQFVTPTPATHARVLARRQNDIARDLRDVFGWSLPFRPETVGDDILGLMRTAEVLEPRDSLFASKVRVSTLRKLFFLHSRFPTTQANAVFFGPDSYRFAAFIDAELPRLPPRTRIVDLGAGSGVGAVIAAQHSRAFIIASDINETALELCAANMAFNGVSSLWMIGDGLGPAHGAFDTVIANPPYIADPLHRAYRDGGAMHGAALSLDWARQAGEQLPSGGALLLYTGSAIIDGQDPFKATLLETLRDFDVSYRELDPDVFGEELEREDYADVERIAVVGVVAVKR